MQSLGGLTVTGYLILTQHEVLGNRHKIKYIGKFCVLTLTITKNVHCTLANTKLSP